MKKMMTVLAACAVTSLALAEGPTVVSGNIVGYQTLNLSGNNYNMLAVNWEKIGGGNVGIQELVDTSKLTSGYPWNNADNVLVWDPVTTGYKTYYLYTDGKWYDASDDILPSTNTFSAGTAFWLLRFGVGDTNVTISGQASQQATYTFPIKQLNYNLIGSPFASDYPLNSTYDWVASGATAGYPWNNADNILVWNPVTTGYKTYYLYTDGKWYDASDDVLPTTDKLPLGKGAWYLTLSASDWTLTMSKPY